MSNRKSIFHDNTEAYEVWFKRNNHIFESELAAIKEILPCFSRGIEIGVGTGIFASSLGIKEGVEPSVKMSAKAKDRGINVIDAYAEKLPIASDTYDLALMVTVDCFLDDVLLAFKEIWRVLSPGGCFIVAFIDRETTLGEKYKQKKASNEFYQHADFHSSEEMIQYLCRAGFEIVDKRQTIYTMENTIQSIKRGVGEGLFAVIKANKAGKKRLPG